MTSAVVAELWYTSPVPCTQGPFTLDIDALGGRWGEGVELMVHTPRRVRLTIEVLQDESSLKRETVSLGGSANSRSALDNQRCVADAIELDTNLGSGAGGTPGSGTSPAGPQGQYGSRDPNAPDAPPSPPTNAPGMTLTAHPKRPPRLELTTAIGWTWWNDSADAPPPLRPGSKLRIRIWSSVPNDLDKVFFVVVQSRRKPSVDDETYAQHLRNRRAAEEERMRQAIAQQEAEARRRADQETNTISPEEAERRRRERLEHNRREAEERARRRILAERLAEESRRRREAYCDAHKEDTSCWGPGGFEANAEFLRRKAEREAWCKEHPAEARCFSQEDWNKRRASWDAQRERARIAQNPPEPSGPPPLAKEETQPPKPSVNAEWRPGYWHWDGTTWHWLAGLWRVPESDITAELTVKAPSTAPQPKQETPPPPPMATAVWLEGYWQWDGGAWVWVPGSWQLPPSAEVEWQPPRWEPRGTVHIFVPGGWMTIRRAR